MPPGITFDLVHLSSAHLMFQEEGSKLSFRPEVHGIGQQFCGDCVDTKEVPHKHHTLDFLIRRETKTWLCVWQLRQMH